MKKIIFLHTDLGLGGAEQLVVTAALALRLYKNAEVEILTTRYDPKRCFDETRRDIAVTCVGSFLPFTILGKLRAFCSFIRMLYMSCYVLFQSFFFGQTFDAIIVDAISTTVPILKWCKKPVCFYCHFPDALLCTTSGGWLKRQYRTVMDGLERLTIGAADELCVNSRFTKSILREHYPHLKKRQIHIIYPCVNGVSLKKNKKTVKDWSKIVVEFPRELENLSPRKYILSLNRYERKKSLGRAIQVLVWLKNNGNRDVEIPSLVFAGGYDTQVTENVEVYRELQQEAAGHWERDRLHIVFLKSIEDRLRWCLLRHAIALIYTPSQEHFGIVPLEAMAMGCPVIACASGGVPETVINEKTGYLCPDDIENNIPGEFGKALSRILAMSESERDNQRHECEKHVEDMFNTRDLADRLAKVIHLVA